MVSRSFVNMRRNLVGVVPRLVHPQKPDVHLLENRHQALAVVVVGVRRDDQVDDVGPIVLTNVLDQLLAVLRVAAVHDADELLFSPAVQIPDAEGDCVAALLATLDGEEVESRNPWEVHLLESREVPAQLPGLVELWRGGSE